MFNQLKIIQQRIPKLFSLFSRSVIIYLYLDLENDRETNVFVLNGHIITVLRGGSYCARIPYCWNDTKMRSDHITCTLLREL